MGILLKDFLIETNLKEFFVMDTETTGFKPATADVIEVSAVKVRNYYGTFTILDTFDVFINPGYPLPEPIVKFNEENGTGICDEFLADKPDSKTAAQMLYDFLGDKPVYVVGHNLDSFDVPFIEKLLHHIGKEFDIIDSFDTLTFIQAKEGKVKGIHKLCNIVERSEKIYSNGNSLFHTSIADCIATLDVLDYETKAFCPELELKPAPKKIKFHLKF